MVRLCGTFHSESIAYHHTKNKQTKKKMVELADKLVSSKPFYFSAAFRFFSSLFLRFTFLYVSAIALNKAAML